MLWMMLDLNRHPIGIVINEIEIAIEIEKPAM